MTRRDVTADILDRLSGFIEHGRKLPVTVDGKVNVVALCRDLGLLESDSQHFHRKDALKSAVNGIAAAQGLRGVGARGQPVDEAEATLERRIADANSNARQDALAASEAAAARDALAAELRAAQAEIADLRVENRALAERLRLLEETGLMFDRGSSW
jgi:hypothetical protein